MLGWRYSREEEEEKYKANYHESQDDPTDPVIPGRVSANIIAIEIVTATNCREC